MREQFQIMGNEEFEEEWFHENEEGLAGGWDAARRDKELDADGVAGEVIFPDADAVTAATSAPFGAGLGMSSRHDPDAALAGARAHNRWLAELCDDSPERRAGVALVPILTTSTPRSPRSAGRASRACAAASSSRRCGQPYAPYHDAVYDPVWAVCEELADAGAHALGRRAARGLRHGPATSASTPPRCASGRRARCGSCLVGRVRALPRPAVRRSPSAARSGRPTCCGGWTSSTTRDHGTRKLGEQLAANLTMRPSEYFDRNCFIGASNTRRRELARRYEIGVGNIMWGNDFPHPEGTWPHTARVPARARSATSPSTRPPQMLGAQRRPSSTASTSTRCARSPTGSARPPRTSARPHPRPRPPRSGTAIADAGRPWLTGIEAVPVPVRSTDAY